MATPEEIQNMRNYEAWFAEQEGRPKTRPTNPNAGMADPAELMQMMLQMQEQQQQNIPIAKDEGILGGLGQSSRNPGGRNNTGIDWLKGNYNPDNNPFEGRNPQAEAMGAVENAKYEQGQRRNQETLGIAQNGTLNRDIGGATMGSFYGPDRGDQAAAYGLGNPTTPVMNVLNIPDQYGGGKGYGSTMTLPQADPSLLLPTGGYNAEAGIGGSGIPMSAGEAQGVGNLGNGIYAPRDAQNPASQDAIMARQALAQGGINQRLKEFYTNPFSGPQAQQQQAPAAPTPNVVQALPGLPKPTAASDDEIRANNNIQAQFKQMESPRGTLPTVPDLPSPFLQSYIGGVDRLNENTINPAFEYLTGQQEVYPPELLQRLLSSLLR
jgi:hypothetical protein